MSLYYLHTERGFQWSPWRRPRWNCRLSPLGSPAASRPLSTASPAPWFRCTTQTNSRRLSGSIWNVPSCVEGMAGPDENASCVTFAPRIFGEKYTDNIWNVCVSTSIKRSVVGDPLLLRGRGPTIALPQLRTHIRPKSLVMKFFSVGYGTEPPHHATSCEGVHSPMFDSRRTSYNISKRSLDIAVSVFLLLILWPLLLLLALLVYIRLGSPVLYRQTRPGLHGKPFQMYKFRTMTNDRDRAGNLLPDEERLTSFGQILRRCSLDELPEIINVLRGEMSIVGPRPLLMQYLDRYTPEQARRHL